MHLERTSGRCYGTGLRALRLSTAIGLFGLLSGWTQAGFALDWKPDQVLVGYGSSLPGFGDTTERVQAADLALRWDALLRNYEPASPGSWKPASHHLWMETTFHAMLSDTDTVDRNDYGLFTFAFLGAWVFSPLENGIEPYVFLGGGPVYVAADVEGVGADVCGHYQAGVGLKGLRWLDRTFELGVRYHHVSNLGLADPNVSMNAVRISVAFPL